MKYAAKLWPSALVLCGVIGLCALGHSQPAPPNQANNPTPISTTQLNLPLFALSPQPATNATIQLVGNPGPQTVYYWISANYLVGSANLAGPYPILNAPSPLSSTNYVTISPVLPSGALTYDVLKTFTPAQPTGACACAVAIGVSPGNVAQDQSSSTLAYTVNPINIAALNFTVQNEVQSSGVSHLILRQNQVFVCDLSVGCGTSGGTVSSITAGTGLAGSPNPIVGIGTISLANTAVTPGNYTNLNATVNQQGQITAASNGSGGGGSITGSGNSPFFPIWVGTNQIGNSLMQAVTNASPSAVNGINYSFGSGLDWQLDGSGLYFNSGVSGSGNVLIQNQYAPGGGNNAGGIVVESAPATGSACAGSAQLLGASTNAAGNGGSVTVGSACSNGFGAVGASVSITAGSTSASNAGGTIFLHPGTGGFSNGSLNISGLSSGFLNINSGGTVGSTTNVITAVTAGTGLAGGGTSGAVTLSLQPNTDDLVQHSVVTGCGSTCTFTYATSYATPPGCWCSGYGGSCNIASVTTTACVINTTVSTNFIGVTGTK